MLRQAQATGDVGEGQAGVVRVGPNRRAFALAGALSLGLAAAWLLPVLLSPSLYHALWALLGGSLPGALFCGALACFYLGVLRPGRAAVILDAEGVRDRTRPSVEDVIRWEEIASVALCGWGPFQTLRIRVRDLDAVLARQRPLTRFAVGMGWPVGGTPLGIGGGSIDVPLVRLKEQIEARLARRENERRWWTQPR